MHWLVSEKKADIETSDRGCFTPVSPALANCGLGPRHVSFLASSYLMLANRIPEAS